MALRTATATSVTVDRSPLEWRRLVEQIVAEGARACRDGSPAGLAAAFASIDGLDDPQRAYQARCRLVEAVLAAHAEGFAWAGLYATAAEALLGALEREPSEPVLANALGVLLYELLELPGARACFEAAARLDPELEHVRANLTELGRREQARARSPLPKGLAARVRVLGSRAAKLARRASPATGLTLSLCMIVKDEEELLPGCLAAVRDAVDEIVVVDTGSSDATVEIAKRYGARIVRFPWNGSFADARNVSLQHATGDWILYLDADEHVFPEDAAELRGLLGRTWREGFYLVETNYTGGEESGHAVTHLALRLFRNRPAYRFEGRIHEQKTQTMPTYLPERFETTRIRLRHYGYLKHRLLTRDKSRRNVELLERERAESPGPFNSFNLGSEHMALGEWDEARRYFDEAWEQLRSIDGWEGVPYAPLLASRVVRVRREAGDTDGARRAIAEGLATFTDHTDLVFEEALCARDDGDLEEAATLAERCLALGDAPARYAATVGSGSHLALTLLGDIRAAQGRPREAEALYRRSLGEHGDFVAPVLHLASLLIRREAEDTEVEAAVADAVAKRPSAMLLLATALYEGGRAEGAETWFRRVLARQPGNGVARIGLVESLLSQRRYGEAVDEARLESVGSPVRPLATLALLFGLAASGDAGGLTAELAGERAGELGRGDLELYRAWQALLTGGAAPRRLSPDALGPLTTALEALLRVVELEAFERLVSLAEAAVPDPRERRELLARMYLRRGFLESAADEWIAVCLELPDPAALVGLAQVAVARGFDADALGFVEEALSLDPACAEAARLAAALERRESARTQAAPAA